MEAFIGMMMPVGFNFAPRGWSTCQGQLMAIAQNTALFSLLGTMYGGDGTVTFGLPDLRGRSPIGQGQGPGLGNYSIGEMAGVEAVTLLSQQMPAHSHTLAANGADANDQTPINAFPAAGGAYQTTANGTMNSGIIGASGGNAPHENRPPYIALNWVICLEGIFPSRN